MTTRYDVIVIGGGASGAMAAGRAAERGRRVLLLEKNSRLGVKLSLTGGGRCNICNAEDDIHLLLQHYGPANKFLHSPFSRFGVADTFRFFESRGLPLKVEAQKRAFPQTEDAHDVVKLLETYLHKGRVEIRFNAEVSGCIAKDNEIVGVQIGKTVETAKSYIFATGGKSHPETGSTGDGFRWLSEFQHAVTEPTPSVVPLAVRERWVKALAGVSFEDARVTFFVDGKKHFSVQGNILCTHFGLSGPTILNAAGKVSRMLKEGHVTATIDAFPKKDLGELDTYILDVLDQHKNKELGNAMKYIAPKGTSHEIMSLLSSMGPKKKVHSVSRMERKKIVNLFKAFPVTIEGLMGYDRAVVADGGVELSEIDAKTMRSRRYRNLFVTGDLLNITRPSGGYSLQLCWTTGWVAGCNA